jgi:hypothetical protein
MKKTLLGTAAALTLLTGPAMAGPALDTFTDLIFEAGEISHLSERVEGDVEIYEGLEILIGGDLVRADIARLRADGATVSLSAEGVVFTPQAGEKTTLDLIDLSVPVALGSLPTESLWLGEGGVRINPELCAALRTPFRIFGTGITLGQKDVIASVQLDASVSGPDETCLLDLTQKLTGVAVTYPAGLGIRIAEQRFALKTPITPGLPEVATGETWSSEFSMSDSEVSLNGEVELRLDRMDSATRINGDTLLPLAAAGHTRELAKAIAAGSLPEGQLPWADLWNGMRAMVAEGQIRVTGLEVVGPSLSALIGVSGPLDPGSRIDLNGTALKDEGGITASLTLDGTKTALLAVDFGIVTGPADPSFNDLPPSALLTGAPLSLSGAAVRLSDRGAGSLVAQIIGADPYELLAGMLPDWIGSDKTTIVTAWFDKAKNGGVASLRAAPAEPVPVLMIGMMGLGDWEQLGKLLSVTQAAE